MEDHAAFHLLHDLVDVSVQNRHRTEAPQLLQQLRRIIRAPAPRLIHVQSGMCANTTIGVLAERPLRSSRPSRAVPRPGAGPAGLELQDVDQRDEVDARMIEAVVAPALGGLAESAKYSDAPASARSCSPGVVCSSLMRRRASNCCAQIELGEAVAR